jgi:pyruvate dehydrogenase E1 component alpha subunit
MMIERFDPLKGERLQVLDPDGNLRKDLEPALSADDLRRMYERMVLTRLADAKALKLQRQGRFGTHASSRGHEACQVGMATAVAKGDWLFPYFRDLGAYLTLGYPLKDFYHYWMGNEAGMRTPDGLNVFPVAIPVASQIPHAVGAGMAANYRKLPVAVFCTFGDGATSQGDFHEGLNFAGVFKTPNVFVCYNNQFAISLPRSRQTAAATIAQKAVAYGFPGVQVDGNDVLAVYAASAEAAAGARRGGGPTLIEAYTYRMGDHTTSDDAARYRLKDELAEWEKRDPIVRFRKYLKTKGVWDDAYEKRVQEESSKAVEEAVGEAESRPPAAIKDLFAYTYAAMTPNLEEEMADAEAGAKEASR